MSSELSARTQIPELKKLCAAQGLLRARGPQMARWEAPISGSKSWVFCWPRGLPPGEEGVS